MYFFYWYHLDRRVIANYFSLTVSGSQAGFGVIGTIACGFLATAVSATTEAFHRHGSFIDDTKKN